MPRLARLACGRLWRLGSGGGGGSACARCRWPAFGLCVCLLARRLVLLCECVLCVQLVKLLL